MPDTWYSISNSAADIAQIDLYGEIGAWGISSKDFVAELREVTAGEIALHVNSPGGSVDDGLAIYNALQNHPANVTAFVDAAAFSIASIVVQGANRRVMQPHSRMMIHNAMAMGMGYASDFEKVAQHLRETSETIATIYSEKTGKETDYWLQKMDAETRFTDKQAVAEGLADEVGRSTNLAAFKIAANFEWSRFVKNHTEIIEEFLANAEAPGVNNEAIENAVTEGIRKGVGEVVAAVERLIEGKRIDPSDAARRELEEALARVQL